MQFSQAVEDQIAAGFAESAQSNARDALPSANQLPTGAPYERVLLAVIQLAAGDLDKLAQYAAAARRDWRDVLYWTEEPTGSDEPQSWEELKSRLGLRDE